MYVYHTILQMLLCPCLFSCSLSRHSHPIAPAGSCTGNVQTFSPACLSSSEPFTFCTDRPLTLSCIMSTNLTADQFPCPLFIIQAWYENYDRNLCSVSTVRLSYPVTPGAPGYPNQLCAPHFKVLFSYSGKTHKRNAQFLCSLFQVQPCPCVSACVSMLICLFPGTRVFGSAGSGFPDQAAQSNIGAHFSTKLYLP